MNYYKDKIIGECLTFDDVLIVPDFSNVIPKDVDLKASLTNHISLNIPIVSAAMDRVTESKLAIALSRQGGIGIIHKNMTPEMQAEEVDKVKRSESGLITNPITLERNATIKETLSLMSKYHISGLPVTENGKLIGIITNRDIRFITDFSQKVDEVMTKENLVKAGVGVSITEAKELLRKHRIEKLLIVDNENNLKGLITIKDINKVTQYPNSCKDSKGRLRVGAAISISKDALLRIELLNKADLDVIVIDTAHGHSQNVLNMVRTIKEKYPDMEIIAGNIATAKAAEDLIKSGVNALKVGMGPGSICTTRIIAGIGIPQLSAIMDCAEVADKYKIPIIADGGIRYSGDITKALVAGANSVMLGNLLAGLDESPGDLIFYGGRQYKEYRAMGSIEAMKEGGGERYSQEEREPSKLVPEGIVGRVPYRGKLHDFVFQLIGGLRAGMGYVGASNIEELRKKGKFVRITSTGVKESHPHDVSIVREAPNYWIE
jgi:IMP dehydrogenase